MSNNNSINVINDNNEQKILFQQMEEAKNRGEKKEIEVNGNKIAVKDHQFYFNDEKVDDVNERFGKKWFTFYDIKKRFKVNNYKNQSEIITDNFDFELYRHVLLHLNDNFELIDILTLPPSPDSVCRLKLDDKDQYVLGSLFRLYYQPVFDKNHKIVDKQQVCQNKELFERKIDPKDHEDSYYKVAFYNENEEDLEKKNFAIQNSIATYNQLTKDIDSYQIKGDKLFYKGLCTNYPGAGAKIHVLTIEKNDSLENKLTYKFKADVKEMAVFGNKMFICCSNNDYFVLDTKNFKTIFEKKFNNNQIDNDINDVKDLQDFISRYDEKTNKITLTREQFKKLDNEYYNKMVKENAKNKDVNNTANKSLNQTKLNGKSFG